MNVMMAGKVIHAIKKQLATACITARALKMECVGEQINVAVLMGTLELTAVWFQLATMYPTVLHVASALIMTFANAKRTGLVKTAHNFLAHLSTIVLVKEVVSHYMSAHAILVGPEIAVLFLIAQA